MPSRDLLLAISPKRGFANSKIVVGDCKMEQETREVLLDVGFHFRDWLDGNACPASESFDFSHCLCPLVFHMFYAAGFSPSPSHAG